MNISPGPSARVVKDSPKKPSKESIEWLIHNWARWMRSGQLEKWYPGQSAGLSTGGASESFDDLLERCERDLAKTTDTVIKDLPLLQQNVIHHVYLHAVFRFRSQSPISHALLLAKEGITAGLKKRHIEIL